MERLQKVLAQSNIASRRKAETLIIEGRVKVNGKVVLELGYKVDEKDQITVDGIEVQKADFLYFLLNKPTGYVSTASDEKGRRIVLDLLDEEHQGQRIYPVGRLDYDTAGLLLLTNDGALTEILTHPSFEVEKEYLVRVKGIVIKDKIRQLRMGVKVDGVMTKPTSVKLIELDKDHQSTLISVTLTEGRNKIVRNLMKAIGHPVKNLTRVRYDFLTLEGVKRGGYRPLKIHEVKRLYANKHIKKDTWQ